MKTPEQLAEVNVNRWWWLKRFEYNKGLLISGAITFLLTCFTATAFINVDVNYEDVMFFITAFAIIYFIYIIVANLLYTLGWVADVALNKHNEENFREIIFKCGYWLSVVAPPAVILIYILVVFAIMPQHVHQTLPQ